MYRCKTSLRLQSWRLDWLIGYGTQQRQGKDNSKKHDIILQSSIWENPENLQTLKILLSENFIQKSTNIDGIKIERFISEETSRNIN